MKYLTEIFSQYKTAKQTIKLVDNNDYNKYLMLYHVIITSIIIIIISNLLLYKDLQLFFAYLILVSIVISIFSFYFIMVINYIKLTGLKLMYALLIDGLIINVFVVIIGLITISLVL